MVASNDAAMVATEAVAAMGVVRGDDERTAVEMGLKDEFRKPTARCQRPLLHCPRSGGAGRSRHEEP